MTKSINTMDLICPLLVAVLFFGVTMGLKLEESLMSTVNEEASGNWMIAPSSLSSALGMLYLGARGKTAEEIGSLLSLPADPDESRRALFNRHNSLLEGRNQTGITWDVANKILVSNEVPLKKSLQADVGNHFQAKIENADFSNPQKTAADVNKWVNETTRGFLPELLKPDNIESDLKMLILNAVYFKGSWKSSFDPKMTRKDCFYSKPGICSQVDFMSQKKSFPYGVNQQLKGKILELPYGESSDFSMVIVLPNEDSTISELIGNLKNFNFTDMMSQLYKTEITVNMPKFAFEHEMDLTQHLKKAGMEQAFSNLANLTGFSENEILLKVSKVIHKTKMLVNEEGTEASGSTVIGLVPLSLPVMRSEVIIMNRPFYFVIKKSNEILFQGVVNTLN